MAQRLGWMGLAGAVLFVIGAAGCNVLIGAEKGYHLEGEPGGSAGTGGASGNAGSAGNAGSSNGGTAGASSSAGGSAGSMPCGMGGTLCDGECVDLMTDPDNCSICGSICEPGQGCHDGVCACPTGWVSCGMPAACVDPASDPANCGMCGNSCGMSPCLMGSCVTDTCVVGSPCMADSDCCVGYACEMGQCGCVGGRTSCNGQCVDLLSDPKHCGMCGVSCVMGTTCLMGACM